MKNADARDAWLKEGSKFVKIAIGQEYTAVFRGMEFDPTGGYQDKPCMKYKLEDLEDGEIREFSSASKALAGEMMKVQEGDTIKIAAKEEKGKKKYVLTIVKVVSGQGDDEEESGKDTGSKEVPF